MDDLPELPFEKVLSYLSLGDRLKSRAVARSWYNKIDSFKVKSLCYSSHPSGFIFGKSRLVSGAFARNFISSSRFESFFSTFGRTILRNLKHLRLCDLEPNVWGGKAFAPTLQSFDQLEELAFVRFRRSGGGRGPRIDLELNLPMLKSIAIYKVNGITLLTLDAPRLQEVKLEESSLLTVDIAHTESVERLLIDLPHYTSVENLKNLKHLYCGHLFQIDFELISDLKQLKEIHVGYSDAIAELFQQNEQQGRTDLKVFYWGLLLDGPGELATSSPYAFMNDYINKANFALLAENPSRLADEIPLHVQLNYKVIEPVAPGSEMNVLSRLTDLNRIKVTQRVQDTQRFLDVLKNCGHIAELRFVRAQPQELFDRLPEHSAVQRLTIDGAVSDVRFLFRLKHLNHLGLDCSIDAETIRNALEELPFLTKFDFKYANKKVEIDHLKRFEISVAGKKTSVADLDAAIQFVTENAIGGAEEVERDAKKVFGIPMFTGEEEEDDE